MTRVRFARIEDEVEDGVRVYWVQRVCDAVGDYSKSSSGDTVELVRIRE